MKIRTLLLATSLSIVLAGNAHAVTAVFNTGVDSNGNRLSTGVIDSHWTQVNSSGNTSNAYVVGTNPAWSSPSDARWIWAQNTNTTGALAFQLLFDLSGYDLSTVSLSGYWGVDNTGSISINGNTSGIGTGTLVLPSVVAGNYNPLHLFTIDSGFVDGENTLRIDAYNNHFAGAVIVSRLTVDGKLKQTSTVPDSTGLAVLPLVLVGLFAVRRQVAPNVLKQLVK